MCSVSLSLFCFFEHQLWVTDQRLLVVGFCQIRNTQKLNVSTFKRNLEEQVYHFTSSFIIFPTGLIRVKPGTNQADFQPTANWTHAFCACVRGVSGLFQQISIVNILYSNGETETKIYEVNAATKQRLLTILNVDNFHYFEQLMLVWKYSHQKTPNKLARLLLSIGPTVGHLLGVFITRHYTRYHSCSNNIVHNDNTHTIFLKLQCCLRFVLQFYSLFTLHICCLS